MSNHENMILMKRTLNIFLQLCLLCCILSVSFLLKKNDNKKIRKLEMAIEEQECELLDAELTETDLEIRKISYLR